MEIIGSAKQTGSSYIPIIKNTNVFLANIDKVPIKLTSDQALLDRMKGEAYFIRAYDYTQLLRSFGGVVLVDKPFELGQDYLTSKTVITEGNEGFYPFRY